MKQLNWYQIFGQTKVIPDGKTVEPTDDIQIWLHCADIWNKTYTTLAEVLADADTLSALINSNNAVDYLVRSKKWCGIGLVPIMTSNTTPSGVCIGSTFYGTGNEFYKAFDSDSSTLWASQNSDKTNAWIGYAFDTPVICTSFILNSYTGRTFATVYVEGSDDGITWTTLNGGSTINVTSAQDNPTKFIFANSTAYLKYRLRTATQVSSSWNCNVRELQFCMESLCDNATAMSYIGLNNYCANTLIDDADWLNSICKSTYFESVLNVENPTMTTPTTPSGVVFASGDENGWRARAFDKNNTAHNYGWCPGTQAKANDYLGYQFASAKRIVMCRILTYTGSAISRTGIVQKSADNITWDNTDSYCYIGSGYNDKIQILPFANANDLAYYRVYFNGPLFSAHNFSAYVTSITFYGRKDI
jgi:hypothetical protein